MTTQLKVLAAFVVVLLISVQAQVAGEALVTRALNINPAQLKQIPFSLGDDAENILTSADLDETRSLERRLRFLFALHGVAFADPSLSNSTALNEKSMFFNDRTGALIVRTTPDEMKKIDRSLESLSNPVPPRVLIEV